MTTLAPSQLDHIDDLMNLLKLCENLAGHAGPSVTEPLARAGQLHSEAAVLSAPEDRLDRLIRAGDWLTDAMDAASSHLVGRVTTLLGAVAEVVREFDDSRSAYAC